MSIHANPITGKIFCAETCEDGSHCARRVRNDGDRCFQHRTVEVTNFDEQEAEMKKARQKFERDFLTVAKNILGSGYVEEYYDQTICSELRWSFALGWREGQKAAT